MKRIGIVYLALYLADSILSLISLILHSLEAMSNGLSLLQLPFTIAILVLACSDRLHPRKPYFIATGYYFFMLAFGTVATGLVVAKGDAGAILNSEHTGLLVLEQQLPWVAPVIWVLTAVMVAVAVYALRQANKGVALETEKMGS